MKIVIFGSCVSRDMMEVAPPEIELVAYYARSSLGSAFSHRPMLNVDLSSMPSAFQKRMVEADLTKTFPKILPTLDFDILLYDPIDERFNLFQDEDGSLCTISNELRSSGFEAAKRTGRIIPACSEEFLSLWEKGWIELIELLTKIKQISKFRINKVYWSNNCENGESFLPVYNNNCILKNNKFLNCLYNIIAKTLPSKQMYNFDNYLFLGKNEHKWGKSPFHYVDQYYDQLAAKILQPCTE